MTGADTAFREANSGGPRSRSRTERLTSSVLGQDDGPIRCRRLLRVGLDFGSNDPLDVVRKLVHDCGFDGTEEARLAMILPAAPCICRVDAIVQPPAVASLTPEDALFQALVLGLCTPWRYDPGRPVLWTRTSLTRRLELFSGQEFYA
jgi:hypothetical protein